MKRAIVIALLAACASKPKPSAPANSPPPPPAAVTELGGACSDGACAAGQECVQYYGIAGKAGPALSSCEIRCKQDGDCPTGHACKTIADGPGQVCRK
jgi:hypothetical protein